MERYETEYSSFHLFFHVYILLGRWIMNEFRHTLLE